MRNNKLKNRDYDASWVSIRGKPNRKSENGYATEILPSIDLPVELSKMVFNKFQVIRSEIFAQTGVDIQDEIKYVESN